MGVIIYISQTRQPLANHVNTTPRSANSVCLALWWFQRTHIVYLKSEFVPVHNSASNCEGLCGVEWRCSFNQSQPPHQMEVTGQLHCPADLNRKWEPLVSSGHKKRTGGCREERNLCPHQNFKTRFCGCTSSSVVTQWLSYAGSSFLPYILHVRSSFRIYQRSSEWIDFWWNLILETFMKTCRENLNLLKIGHFTWRNIYFLWLRATSNHP
jgi:hypothetical protein